MIKLNEKYYIGADGNGYSIFTKKIAIRKEDDPDGKFKKGDEYPSYTAQGYAGNFPATLNIYISTIVREKAAEDEIMEMKDFIAWNKEFIESIKLKFKL